MKETTLHKTISRAPSEKEGFAVKNKGSFTVEAALIIPGIILLVFMLITANFILHDRLTADALTAYETEEARMAVQYGRVPYPTGSAEIAGTAFKSEDGMEELSDLVVLSREDMEKTFMFSSVMSKKAKVFEDYVTATTKISPVITKVIVSEGLGEKTTSVSCRTCGDFASAARVTKTVYRTVKTVTE